MKKTNKYEMAGISSFSVLYEGVQDNNNNNNNNNNNTLFKEGNTV